MVQIRYLHVGNTNDLLPKTDRNEMVNVRTPDVPGILPVHNQLHDDDDNSDRHKNNNHRADV
jgi:hypothetical protein